jgi:hypothetical protein
MTQVVSPSDKPITEGQAGKFYELFTTRLRKSEIGCIVAQRVLEEDGAALAEEMFMLIRKRVDARQGMIVRRVKPNRARSPQEMLDATNRRQYTDKAVVKAMPKGEGDEVDVVFFKVGRYISDTDLDAEYELRGLKPADPYSQAAVNEADPAFADEHPNGTHWKDKAGNWCFATFRRWFDERSVNVFRLDFDWDGSWWFAGVRK